MTQQAEDDGASCYWEALERAMNEMDVLRAIYGGDEDNGNDGVIDAETETSFDIVYPGKEELNQVRRRLGLYIDNDSDNDEIDGDNSDSACTITTTKTPELQIEIRTRIDFNDDDDGDKFNDDDTLIATLRYRLPSGYPEYSSAVVTSIRMVSLTRSTTDEIARTVNEKADALLGTESIMDLIEDAKELLFDHHCRNLSSSSSSTDLAGGGKPNTDDSSAMTDECCYYGRRWIWVHHITSSDRRKSIVREARELNLTGILKHGYPGVVLVEGLVSSCDEFVMWIKGNKSRPGGFGRNWGHHVRGEINFNFDDEPLLAKPTTPEMKTTMKMKMTEPLLLMTTKIMTMTMTTTFEEIEDLSVMARSCKEMGLEDEFKEFVMQHKKIK